ncbi:hypothetical protein LZC95_20190 [Pendulispora brunnea]|uniref:Uncharacterized protein n=1 Tax=Pendulispora brunnea TaxID=2905690 RepID=A0ABZ2KQ40_9BACT
MDSISMRGDHWKFAEQGNHRRRPHRLAAGSDPTGPSPRCTFFFANSLPKYIEAQMSQTMKPVGMPSANGRATHFDGRGKDMLPGWRQETILNGGRVEAIFYFDPDLENNERTEIASRRIRASADGVLITIGALQLGSFLQVGSFEYMLWHAYSSASKIRGSENVDDTPTGEGEIFVKASGSGIALVADAVRVKSALDVLQVLRPVWSAWREVEEIRGRADVERRFASAGMMLEQIAVVGARETRRWAADTKDSSLAVECWAAGVRTAAEVLLRLPGIAGTERGRLALQKLERSNHGFASKQEGRAESTQILTQLNTYIQDAVLFGSIGLGSPMGW